MEKIKSFFKEALYYTFRREFSLFECLAIITTASFQSVWMLLLIIPLGILCVAMSEVVLPRLSPNKERY